MHKCNRLLVSIVVKHLNLSESELNSQVRPCNASLKANVAYLNVHVWMHQLILNYFADRRLNARLYGVYTYLELAPAEELSLSTIASFHSFL